MTVEDVYEKKYGSFKVKTYKLVGLSILVYEMEGFLQDEFAKEYIADLVTAASEHKPKAMIADARKIKALSNIIQEAIQKNFWPSIANLGVVKNGAVMPQSAIGSLSVTRMAKGVGQVVEMGNGKSLQINQMGSMEDCIKWCGN